MSLDQNAINNIAISLSRHFESVYYVDVNSWSFTEVMNSSMLLNLNLPKEGEDFLALARNNAHLFVHPDDLQDVLNYHDKNFLLKNLQKETYCFTICRVIINEKIIHVRHVCIMCDDKKHIICCMENIEKEYQEKLTQERNLKSAELLARRDELTGIKNKNAFEEFSESINECLKTEKEKYKFAIVMCDVNNLKVINDTRGHSFGDEMLQRASLMIRDVFNHCSVYRIGGDEFAVVLAGADYEKRHQLIKQLRDESAENGKLRSGPEVACGLSEFDPQNDTSFTEVFKRADRDMYENKNKIKSRKLVEQFRKMDELNEPIPAEKKRRQDCLFDALYTVSDKGYVYLNNMKYDYSRWSLPLIDDFGMESEYMYHADQVWKNYIHPDDVKIYNDAVDAVLCGNAELRFITYRAKKTDGKYVVLSTRGFVLTDEDGNPEYFGGIIVEN